jgi:hypothetical protein
LIQRPLGVYQHQRRLFWLKPELDLDISGPLLGRSKQISTSGSVWDGIAGIRGNVNLDKNWYIPYYVDMGTGDSTFPWQGMGVSATSLAMWVWLRHIGICIGSLTPIRCSTSWTSAVL